MRNGEARDEGMKLEEVRFARMRRKDYEEGLVETRPVGNFPEWRGWSTRYWGPGVSREAFDLGCGMLGDNRKRFKRHFGKCAFTYNGSHYFHCWVADLGTAQVVVLTAMEHGTCYEVVVKRAGRKVRKDISKVLEFMEMVGGLP